MIIPSFLVKYFKTSDFVQAADTFVITHDKEFSFQNVLLNHRLSLVPSFVWGNNESQLLSHVYRVLSPDLSSGEDYRMPVNTYLKQ